MIKGLGTLGGRKKSARTFRTTRTSQRRIECSYDSLEPRKLLAAIVANYGNDFPVAGEAPTNGWAYQWNAPYNSSASSGAIDDPLTRFRPLFANGGSGSLTPDGDRNPNTDPGSAFVRLSGEGGHPGVGQGFFAGGAARYAIASYTVSESGVYEIDESVIGLNPANPVATTDGVEVRVFVNRETPVDTFVIDKDSNGYFDAPLGFLAAGDTIHIAFGAAGNNAFDYFTTDFDIVRNENLEQTVGNYQDDFLTQSPGEFGWSYQWNAPTGWTPGSRGLAWTNGIGDPGGYQELRFAGAEWNVDGDVNRANSSPANFLRLSPTGGVVGNGFVGPVVQDRFAIAAFTVEASGQYGIADSFLNVFEGSVSGIELFVHVENEEAVTPDRFVVAPGQSESFDVQLGYLEKGDTIYVGFGANGNHIRDRFETDFSIVRSLPRAAPDLSLLNEGNEIISVNDSIFGEPGAVPNDHQNDWQAIRNAISLAWPGGKEIHFDKGVYNVSSSGLGISDPLFAISHMSDLVIDGNGSTLIVDETTRPLFHTYVSNNVIFKDLTIDYAERVPARGGEQNDLYRPLTFTQGIISNLDPVSRTFTLTVNTEAFIAPDSSFTTAETPSGFGYALDPHVDGRLKQGSDWHYSTLEATQGARANEFTIKVHHSEGLENGDRYVLQRRHNVSMFGVYNQSSDVSIVNVTAYSAPAVFVGSIGSERVNVLNSHVAIRPDDWSSIANTQRWKSINGDGVHIQSSRVGAWVEDSTFEGLGDDVMNFYSRPMTVVDQPSPNRFTLATVIYDSLANVPERGIRAGDVLTFLDPISGSVIKEAKVIDVNRVERPDPANPSRTIRMRTVTLDQDVDGVTEGTFNDRSGYRNETMVFNASDIKGSLVANSVLSNSRRYGNFLMSSDAHLIDNVYEGLSDEAIAAHNEPGWPLGLFANNVLIQGNDFINNGFSSRYINQEFHTGSVAFKTGRFVDRTSFDSEVDRLVDQNEYTFSNVRILDNVFYNWRKSAVSIRNAQNVTLEGNSIGQAAPSAGEFDRELDNQPLDFHFSKNITLDGNSNEGLDPIESSNVDSLDVRNQQTVFDHGLSTWLKFDRGAVVADSSGSGVRAVFDQAGIVDGRFDTSAVLNGTNSITVDHGLTAPVSTRTVSLFFEAKNVELTSRRQVIFDQGNATSGMNIYIENGELVAGTWGAGFSTFMRTSIESGDWHHVALVLDANSNKVRAYLDGEKFEAGFGSQIVASEASIGRVGFSGTRLENGAVGANGNGFAGKIDDLRIYDRALGDRELKALANAV